MINALPVPTPVLSGSGSLGPSKTRDLRHKATPRRFDFVIKDALYDDIKKTTSYHKNATKENAPISRKGRLYWW